MVRETGVQSQVESYQRLKKMVLDATLLNTQHYEVRIKGKVKQSREWSSALPDTTGSSYWKRGLRDTLANLLLSERPGFNSRSSYTKNFF